VHQLLLGGQPTLAAIEKPCPDGVAASVWRRDPQDLCPDENQIHQRFLEVNQEVNLFSLAELPCCLETHAAVGNIEKIAVFQFQADAGPADQRKAGATVGRGESRKAPPLDLFYLSTRHPNLHPTSQANTSRPYAEHAGQTEEQRPSQQCQGKRHPGYRRAASPFRFEARPRSELA